MAEAADLARFVAAQAPVHGQARAELLAGRKTSHWMWFVFPQLAGLGHSAIARRYALRSAGEARGYLDHPLLGRRLCEDVAIVTASDVAAPDQIFGAVDTLKLRSSLTLFAAVATAGDLFAACLTRHFAGVADPATLRLLADPATLRLLADRA